jgi:predicted house-cleaning NTP pyrophosphatase (Maf/HAM1 superfamily)
MLIAFVLKLCFRICHQEDQKNGERLEMNGTHQLLVCADDVTVLDENINAKRKTQKPCWRLIGWLIYK